MNEILNAIGSYFKKIVDGWEFGTKFSKLIFKKNVEIEGTDDMLYTHEFQEKDGTVAHLEDIPGAGEGFSIDDNGNLQLGEVNGGKRIVQLTDIENLSFNIGDEEEIEVDEKSFNLFVDSRKLLMASKEKVDLSTKELNLKDTSRVSNLHISSGSPNILIGANKKYTVNVTAKTSWQKDINIPKLFDNNSDVVWEFASDNLPNSIDNLVIEITNLYNDPFGLGLSSNGNSFFIDGHLDSNAGGYGLSSWKLEIYAPIWAGGPLGWITVLDRVGVNDIFPIYDINLRSNDSTNSLDVRQNITNIRGIKLTIRNVITGTDGKFVIPQIGILNKTGGRPASEASGSLSILGGRVFGTIKHEDAVEDDESVTLRQLKNYLEATEVNFQNIINDLNLGNLVANTWYKIEDFTTKYQMPNTNVIFTGDLEPLYVLAISENQLSNIAYSQLYPNDIIYYNPYDQICEDGITPRKGRITFRKDVVKDISAYYDWRGSKFRRWKILNKKTELAVKNTSTEFIVTLTFSPNMSSTYLDRYRKWDVRFNVGETHDAGNIFITVTKGAFSFKRQLYKSDGTFTWTANQLAGKNGILVYCPVRNVFVLMDMVQFGDQLAGTYSSAFGTTTITVGNNVQYDVDINDFVDLPTFNFTYNIQNVEMDYGSINNVFLNNITRLKIAASCYNNTFRNVIVTSEIASESYNNIFNGVLQWSTIAAEFQNNLILNNAVYFFPWLWSTNTTYILPAFIFVQEEGQTVNSTIYCTAWFTKISNVEASGIFVTGSSRAHFKIERDVTSSLIGLFAVDLLTIDRRLINTSIHSKPLVDNLLTSLNLTVLPVASGDITPLGRDVNNNLVAASNVITGAKTIQLISNNASLTINGASSSTLPFSSNLVFNLQLPALSLQTVTSIGNTTTTGIVLNGGRLEINTLEDGTASSNAIAISNTNGGGFWIQRRGSTTIRARGDSMTGYFILRLQNNSSTPTTVFEVGSTGSVFAGVATAETHLVRYDQFLNAVGRSLLSNSGTFSHLGALDSIRVRGHSGVVTGTPNDDIGGSVSFHISHSDIAGSMARNFAFYRRYDTNMLYWGIPNLSGSAMTWYSMALLNRDQVVTGINYIRRGTSSTETTMLSFDYPDNDGQDYNLKLYNNSTGNNVRWYYKQKVILGTNSVTLNVSTLGFKNGVTIIGADNYPFADIETYYDAQTNPATRYPLVMYTAGDSMFSGKSYFGKNNFTDLSFLTSNDPVYSQGTIYSRLGFRTPDPENPAVLNHSTWLLGSAAVSSTGTFNRKIKVKVNDSVYELLAIHVSGPV